MFRVQWTPTAFEHIEYILDRAADPDAVVAAVLEFDRMLTDDPVGQSESRPDDVRIAFARPLAALFAVSGAKGTVEILSVWPIRPT